MAINDTDYSYVEDEEINPDGGIECRYFIRVKYRGEGEEDDECVYSAFSYMPYESMLNVNDSTAIRNMLRKEIIGSLAKTGIMQIFNSN